MRITIARLRRLWDPNDILDSLWRICASPHATVLILLCLVILMGMGTVLPQRSAETLRDPVANSLWLASMRQRYGSVADGFLAARLFDLYRSVWLRGLLGLLALNMSLAAVQTLLLETDLPPAVEFGGSTFTRPPIPEAEYVQWLDHLRSTLRDLGYAVRARGESWWFVGRHARNSLVLLLGVLLALGGLALSERTAWWESDVALRPGQSLQLGHGTGLTLHVESLEAANSDLSAAQPRVRTTASLTQSGRKPQSLALESYRPVWRRGLWLHQTLTAPALLIRSRDPSGRALTLQTSESGEGRTTELYLRFRDEAMPRYMIVLDLSSSASAGRSFEQKGNEKWVWVPARDITLHLTYVPASAVASRGTWLVQAYRGAEASPFFDSQFQAQVELDIGADHYSFVPERYLVIRYGHDWGLPLVFAGVGLLALGWLVQTVRTPAVFWMQLQPASGSLTVRFLADAPQESEPWFQTTVQELVAGLELTAVQSAEKTADVSTRGVVNASP